MIAQLTHPTIAAYELGSIHTFKVLAAKGQQQELFTLKTDSDRFCNVCTAFNQQHKGWSILESWEV